MISDERLAAIRARQWSADSYRWDEETKDYVHASTDLDVLCDEIDALRAQVAQAEAKIAALTALAFDRESWGLIVDALIEHRASAEQRKSANSASTSDIRADLCADLIVKINDANRLLGDHPEPQTPRFYSTSDGTTGM
jgi:hypothetical protein